MVSGSRTVVPPLTPGPRRNSLPGSLTPSSEPCPNPFLRQLAPHERVEQRYWEVARIGIAWSLFFLALEFPYRPVHLPLPIRLGLGCLLGAQAMHYAMNDYLKLLVMFMAYAPWSKIFPGTLGTTVPGFNLTNVFLVALLAGWFRQTFTENRKVLRGRAVDVPLLIFVFLSLIALFRGEIERETDRVFGLFVPIKRWLDPMIVFWIFLNNIRNRFHVRCLLTVLMLSTGLIALWGVKVLYLDLGGFSGGNFTDVDRIRISCISGNPNQFGAFLCYYSFYLAAYFWMYSRTLAGWGALAFFLLCGRSMLMTFSRGTTLAFTGASYLTAWLLNKPVTLMVLAPLTLYFALNPAHIPGILVGRFHHTFVPKQAFAELPVYVPTFGEYTVDKHSMGRIAIWYHGLTIVRANPLLGVGFDRFRAEISSLTGGGFDSHNTYLTIAAEMGLPALAVFVWILALFSREAWRVYRAGGHPLGTVVSCGFLAGMVGLLISNVFGFRMNTNEIVYWWWIMAACVIRLREMNEFGEEYDPHD